MALHKNLCDFVDGVALSVNADHVLPDIMKEFNDSACNAEHFIARKIMGAQS